MVPSRTFDELPDEYLTQANFEHLSKLARDHAGLSLPFEKKRMIEARLMRHLRKRGHKDLRYFLDSVSCDENSHELQDLLSIFTTNVTSFFRENHQLNFFAKDVLPTLVKRARSGNRVRIWSAGCSSGQEAYSLAMLAHRAASDLEKLDFRILATDIDRTVLARAVKAEFSTTESASLPEIFAQRYLSAIDGAQSGARINEEITRLVTFRYLNLISDWPMHGGFDVIFCRNVLIYFDESVQRDLWPRFHDVLVPNGWLFIGHSERISKEYIDHFENQFVTSFRRVETRPKHTSRGVDIS